MPRSLRCSRAKHGHSANSPGQSSPCAPWPTTTTGAGPVPAGTPTAPQRRIGMRGEAPRGAGLVEEADPQVVVRHLDGGLVGAAEAGAASAAPRAHAATRTASRIRATPVPVI